MNYLLDLLEASSTHEDYLQGYCQRLSSLLLELDVAAVARAVETFESAWAADKVAYLIGNGGSAAAVSHLLNDFGPGGFVGDGPGPRTVTLTDNIASVTALANDVGYESVFLHQLRGYLREGDVVFALSVSGNSPNVVRAIEWANENGGRTIGCTGFDGGRLAELAQVSIKIPTHKDEYGPVEDVFSAIGHMISGLIAMRRGRKLSH